MKLEIFAIFDEKAEAFLTPFFCPNVAIAIRCLGQAVNDPEHAFAMNPGDYKLYHLGGFDDEYGNFDIHPQPVVLELAANLKTGDTSITLHQVKDADGVSHPMQKEQVS